MVNGDKKEQEREFLEAYEQYADAIFRFCYFKTYDRSVAQDLTQDAFHRTWDYLAQGKQIMNMKAFIFQTAANAIKDYYKKKRPILEHEMANDVTEQIPYHGGAEDAAEVGLLLEHLRDLHDQYREVITLRYVEGLSVKDIAMILGERDNTISVRINRGLKELRERLP